MAVRRLPPHCASPRAGVAACATGSGGYSRRTEESYTDWIKRFIFFHKKRHPRDMGAPEVEAFLFAPATKRNVSASTQNQALAALLFLYREALALAASTRDTRRGT